MKKIIHITASNEDEAYRLGSKQLAEEVGRTIAKDQLIVKLIAEKKGFLGIGKKKIYEVVFKEGLSKEEEGFLDMVVEEISINGTFAVKINEEGVFLKVTPAEGQGTPVHYQQVKNALDKKKIVEIEWQEVQETISKADQEWHMIAPRKPELDRDAEAIVQISKDRLKANLSFQPALGGKKLTIEDLYNILKENGVVYGIIKEQLIKLLKNDEPVEMMLIAEGTSPIPGKDAQLIYHFEQKTSSVGTEREDGSIDFYDLGLITNVQPGYVLVTKKDAEPGKPGKSVTGEELLPPKSKDKELPKGKNVEVKDDHTLIAKIAGQVVFEGKKIHVLPSYEVNGDIDLTTGNIDFVGNVLIRGNVNEGFTINASGNVEIFGHVEAADIEAGGDVVIHKGFIGKEKSQIKAKGNIRVKFIENATIISDNNIIVSDAVMHSNLIAGDSIQVTEKKGLLVGGSAKARNEIEANIIGSSLATITYLEVGFDPGIRSKINKIEKEIEADKLNLDKTNKALIILERLLNQQGKLPQSKEFMYKRLQATRQKITEKMAARNEEIKTLKDKINSSNKGYISVNKTIHPGVKITVGNAQLSVHDGMSATRFVEEKGEITQATL